MTFNRFIIFFKKSTSGYQVCCRIERKPTFAWDYIGFLDHGKEYKTLEDALEYANKYIRHNWKVYHDLAFYIDKEVIYGREKEEKEKVLIDP